MEQKGQPRKKFNRKRRILGSQNNLYFNIKSKLNFVGLLNFLYFKALGLKGPCYPFSVYPKILGQHLQKLCKDFGFIGILTKLIFGILKMPLIRKHKMLFTVVHINKYMHIQMLNSLFYKKLYEYSLEGFLCRYKQSIPLLNSDFWSFLLHQ